MFDSGVQPGHVADRFRPSGMTPVQAQAILRRLDGARTLPDKAAVLAQAGALEPCPACVSAKGEPRAVVC